jgi:hypothetical protein
MLEADSNDDSDQWMWIDQLTINQSVLLERNNQVQMMSEIYGNADSVIVWLGIGDERPRNTENYVTTYEAAKHWKETSDPWALSRALQNEYFERLWVVQEFALAPRVRLLIKDVWIFGDSNIEEFDPQLLLDIQMKLPADTLRFFEIRAKGRLHDLSYVLTNFGDNACEDPRDKIYGLLGIVRIDQRMEVDYKKSPRQVFIDTALMLLISDVLSPGTVVRSHDGLFILGEYLEFSYIQIIGLVMIFYTLLHQDRLYYFRGYSSPVTKLGFEPAEETEACIDRWWFDFQAKRYYVECIPNAWVESCNPATRRLLTESWEKYVPWTDLWGDDQVITWPWDITEGAILSLGQ